MLVRKPLLTHSLALAFAVLSIIVMAASLVACSGSTSAQNSNNNQNNNQGTNPPTISITAPTSGATVSGSVTVIASATSTAGIAGVQFEVDSVVVGAQVLNSPYALSWNTTSVSNGTHTLSAIAKDTLGNTTTSSGVAVTVSNGTTGGGGGNGGSAADADFQSRCTASGVFLCNALAQPSQITGNWGAVQGNCCAGSTPMAIDTNVYPANGGSMVCAVPANATGDDPCSDFFQNFSTTKTLSFSDNSTFYIQMEMWMDAAYLADKPANGEGQKEFILSSGDPPSCTASISSTCQSSCTYAEIVMLNNSYRGNPSGIPQLYQNCGDYAPMEQQVSTSWDSVNYLLQNAQNNCYHYLNPASGQTGSMYFAPYGNCVPFPTNQWFSVEIEVSLGAYNNSDQSYDNSTVNLWVAPVGQPYQQAFNYKMNIHDQAHLGYGKIWLLTYDTAATSWAGNYNVRWAELIGSTNFIPAPQH